MVISLLALLETQPMTVSHPRSRRTPPAAKSLLGEGVRGWQNRRWRRVGGDLPMGHPFNP